MTYINGNLIGTIGGGNNTNGNGNGHGSNGNNNVFNDFVTAIIDFITLVTEKGRKNS